MKDVMDGLVALGLSACGKTIEGVGKDIVDMGQSIVDFTKEDKKTD